MCCLHKTFVFSAKQERAVRADSPVLPAAQSDAEARLLSAFQPLSRLDALALRIFCCQFLSFSFSTFALLDLACPIVCRHKHLRVVELPPPAQCGSCAVSLCRPSAWRSSQSCSALSSLLGLPPFRRVHRPEWTALRPSLPERSPGPSPDTKDAFQSARTQPG